MAAVPPPERLQPALLDRLTDQEPDKKTESRDGRAMSVRRFEESVLRDLGWLLNASNLESAEDLRDYAEVRASVLNYGIPDFSGLAATGRSAASIERAIHTAIATFEPRLDRASLRITLSDEEAERNALSFKIEAQLWAEPVPISLYLKTELDLESGAIAVVGG